VQTAAAEGVVVACENLYDEAWPDAEVSYSADPQCLIGTVEAVDHPCLGVCLDFGHLFLASATQGFDFLCAVRELAPRAAVLHVHDNLGRPQPRPRGESYGGQIIRGEGDLHLPLGWGSIPFEAVFMAAHFGRHPIFVVEINERFWRDDRAVAAQSLERARSLMDVAVHGQHRRHRCHRLPRDPATGARAPLIGS